MTRTERRKLAQAARELAMECVAGTAPEFGRAQEFRRGKPWCALGHVAARAGLFNAAGDIVTVKDAGVGGIVWWAVADANDEAPHGLPWTLLWLADELESQPPADNLEFA